VKKKLKIPDTFVIIYAIIILAAVATWFVPGGHYDRETVTINEVKREILKKGSFTFQESRPQDLAIFTAPMKGFIRMADIIGFIFLVGGSFTLFQKTGAVTAVINEIVTRMKGHEKFIIIIIMVLFSFFGAVFGMCEEAMPFVLVFVPLALALGYDSITGLCLSFLAAGVGFATAFFNPFTVQIAQGVAGIPPITGWEYRLGIWVFVTAFSITWVVRYAEKVKRNPQLSPTYEQDRDRRHQLHLDNAQTEKFNKAHAVVLIVLALGIAGLFVGVLNFKWYIVELAGLFLAMGIIAGFLGGLNADKIASGFLEGCRDMVGAALIVGFAGGILVVLKDGNILDTMLYGMSQTTGESMPLLSIYMQYGVQLFLNVFIPSGTTKAVLTMPLFGPLADLSGVTRQTAVLAYQFGDGFTNMIIPTSGVTVGTLAMAKVSFEKWFRWLLPLEIIFIVLSLLLLIPPVLLHWTGY